MKKELTPEFVQKVLKLDSNYKVNYNVQYINIEVLNIKTKEVRYINIHEFIHTHCKDFLLSYANGLKTVSETKSSDIDKRIIELTFEVSLTVPNLINGEHKCLIKTFTGKSELILYINAVEWLINYRNENRHLSKFWINKY